jgi:hypothetical protein
MRAGEPDMLTPSLSIGDRVLLGAHRQYSYNARMMQ